MSNRVLSFGLGVGWRVRVEHGAIFPIITNTASTATFTVADRSGWWVATAGFAGL